MNMKKIYAILVRDCVTDGRYESYEDAENAAKENGYKEGDYKIVWL